jgi:hypothetical protein
MVAITKITGAIALLASCATAHPGESHSHDHMKREIVAREHHAKVGQRSLSACANSSSAKRLKARNIQRRNEAVKSLRQKRDLKARKFRATRLQI